MLNFNKQFFEERQKLLLLIANKWYLRWLLGLNRLPKELKKKRLNKITPHSIQWDTGKSFTKRGKLRIERQGAFFTRPRFAEALAYNLTPFVYLQQTMKRRMVWRFSPIGLVSSLALLIIPKISFIGFMGTVTDYYAGAGDGVCYREAVESWATARAAASSSYVYVTDASAQFIQSWVSGGYNPIRRAFFPTDTSGLDDTATISAADLKLYGTGSINNTDGVTGYLVATTQASNTTLTTADYDQIGGTSGGTFTYSGWNTAGYNTIALNATGLTWISKTSYTKIGARDGLDFNDTGPATGNNSLSCYFSEQTGTSNDPYLSITYTTGYTMTAAAGSFTLTGQATSFLAQRLLTAVSGSYTYTGVSASLTKGFKIVCDAGSYTVTGFSASLLKGFKIVASAGSYTLTGVSAAFSRGYRLAAEVGSYVLDGIATAFKFWDYQDKNSTSWTDGNKNSTSWTHKNKS